MEDHQVDTKAGASESLTKSASSTLTGRMTAGRWMTEEGVDVAHRVAFRIKWS
jgi:hypothetical protein